MSVKRKQVWNVFFHGETVGIKDYWIVEICKNQHSWNFFLSMIILFWVTEFGKLFAEKLTLKKVFSLIHFCDWSKQSFEENNKNSFIPNIKSISK